MSAGVVGGLPRIEFRNQLRRRQSRAACERLDLPVLRAPGQRTWWIFSDTSSKRPVSVEVDLIRGESECSGTPVSVLFPPAALSELVNSFGFWPGPLRGPGELFRSCPANVEGRNRRSRDWHRRKGWGGLLLASHDYVVRRIKVWHERQFDEVFADVKGSPKPPKFYGPLGRAYIPDVYVANLRLAYEVKTYRGSRSAVPKLKAFVSSPLATTVLLVMRTGTSAGVPRVQHFMWRHDVDCEVMSYRDLPFW